MAMFGKHTNFDGFNVKSDFEDVLTHYTVSLCDDGLECDFCMERAVYIIAGTDEACAVGYCQRCAVEQANSSARMSTGQLFSYTPDVWWKPVDNASHPALRGRRTRAPRLVLVDQKEN